MRRRKRNNMNIEVNYKHFVKKYFFNLLLVLESKS